MYDTKKPGKASWESYIWAQSGQFNDDQEEQSRQSSPAAKAARQEQMWPVWHREKLT